MKSLADIARAAALSVRHPRTFDGIEYAHRGGDRYTAADARRRQLVLLDRAISSDAGEWRTIDGSHVFIKGGKITKGPAALRGKSHAAAVEHHKQHGHDKADPHVAAEQATRDRLAGKKPFQIGVNESKARGTLGHDHPLIQQHEEHKAKADLLRQSSKVVKDYAVQNKSEGGAAYHAARGSLRSYAAGQPSPHAAEWQHLHEQAKRQLNDGGEAKLQVYRGQSLHRDHPIAQALREGRVKVGDTVDLDTPSAQSYSEHRSEAKRYAEVAPDDGPDHFGIVVEHHAAADDVITGERFNKGFLQGEGEIVARHSAPKTRMRLVSVHDDHGVTRATAQPKSQHVAPETREQSLTRYRLARGLGLDVDKPKHGSELGYLDDTDQKAFEHHLDSEYEAKHGVLDENDHVGISAAGAQAEYAHGGEDVLGPLIAKLPHPAPVAKPDAPTVTPGTPKSARRQKPADDTPREGRVATKASLERRLLEHHDAHGRDEADSDLNADGDNEYGHVASERNRTFVGDSHADLPGEVRDYLQGRFHLRRFFKTTTDASQAGGADTMGELGADRYLDGVERLAGGKLARAVHTARQSDDPELRFIAAVHEHAAPTQRGVKRVPLVHMPTDKLDVGHSFTIHGEDFHVAEPDEGEKTLIGPSHYPDLPLSAATHIPIDRGSLQKRETVPTDAGDDFAPFSRRYARHRFIALADADDGGVTWITFHGRHFPIYAQPVAVRSTLTGDRLQMRRPAIEASASQIGVVEHPETGHVIEIRKSGLRHAAGNARHPGEFNALTQIQDVVRGSQYIGSEPPRNNDPNVAAVHHYIAPITFDGQQHHSIVVVKEDVNGKRLYDHHFIKRKSPTGNNMSRAAEAVDSMYLRGAEESIAALRSPVNPKTPAGRWKLCAPARSASGNCERTRTRLAALSAAIAFVKRQSPPRQ